MIWHSNSIDDIINQLDTNREIGLSEEEATRRALHISKKITKKQCSDNPLIYFKNEICTPSYILMLAAVLLAVLFHLIFGVLSLLEPILLAAFAVFKAAVIAAVSYNADKKHYDDFEERAAVTVLRDGAERTVSAAKVVPGDIILVSEGDYLPVDARLLDEINLHCDEFALTGEEVPTQKNAAELPADIAPINERSNMIFAGSHILSGKGVAVVTEIRDYTELAKKKTVDGVEDGSLKIESRLSQLEKLISTGIVATYFILFFVTLISGAVRHIYETQAFLNSLIYALLVVSTLTVSFKTDFIKIISKAAVTAGIKNMRSKGIIVGDSDTIDKISQLDVVCADKTGTLTQNKQVLSKIFNGINEINVETDVIDGESKMLLRLAALCCDGDVKLVNGVSVQSGDPTQTAIIAASMEHLGLGKYELDNIYPRMAAIPFDPNRKLMTTVNVIDGKKYVIVRGAVEQLLPCCDGENARFIQATEKLSAENMRVVGVAMKLVDEYSAEPTPEELENSLHIVGLLALSDLIRLDSKKAVDDCKNAGMKVVMLTGDRKSAAFATAATLGIAENENQVITADVIDVLTDDELCEQIERYTVFSHLDATHRVRIVKALQDAGHSVAVTGDTGANTASLRTADVAYSMGKSGSDSAICESEVIIEDDSFSSVAKSVRYCRGIYHNIAKSLKFFLSAGLGVILAAFIGAIMFGTAVCTNIELIALASIAVIPLSVAIVFRYAESNDLQLVIDNDSGIFNSKFLFDTLFYAIVYCLGAIVSYSLGLSLEGVSPTGFSFITLSLTMLLCSVFAQTDNIYEMLKYKNNRILAIAAVDFLLLLVLSIIGIGRFTAISFGAWMLSLLIAIVTLGVHLAIKYIRK